MNGYRDSKVHGANMEPTWILSAPDEPHIGPMNLAIKVYTFNLYIWDKKMLFILFRGRPAGRIDQWNYIIIKALRFHKIPPI